MKRLQSRFENDKMSYGGVAVAWLVGFFINLFINLKLINEY